MRWDCPFSLWYHTIDLLNGIHCIVQMQILGRRYAISRTTKDKNKLMTIVTGLRIPIP